MYKIVVLFFLAFLLLLSPGATQADSISEAAIEAAGSSYPKVPRPNYKKYRGNSRSKHKRLGFFRRRAARRRAMRKRKNAVPVRKGVISVDEPKGTMPKR
ncbi:hypothetical protein J0X19_20240 [Hymenobacter sp. BT186]|uniref:Uncharacterized protein n=1 Tax=Hymenobacter telluris TaxID=2816474 RepID=A0A939F032_9BACT|nr:hypothetical protein [Hymenobacter telluris]MBO0360301.1 hypothetical protein [Hymenobacter telluris]MBW3376328.1 hypothetical protein [Hymenobacter norwichensis]